MEYTEFITHVQTLAQSESREEVEVATRATLEIIKQIIPSDEREELAAQIPQELGEYLRGSETEPIQSFHLQEFIERISQKESVSPTISIIHVRAVFAVLQNAITPEKFRKFYDYFSHDYEELFNISMINRISV
ncbi:DUF2267 domain-containing protein [Cuspidothrix issatschenkoi LEGE 03284]|jgi:uncharacterized protein (DUF2267 family)|uniref:DUF2267 domain-containing protein n=1 Tax=Cuspidothrix issatschenkoi TaxID=230752 RepID=UPI00187FAD92|nr:DUF2267 domain-containing protein [Cuspidothrix issatschenkoi]MBE9230542.1 DUF2267 domain-containing protein [Cuspidothrix issatschenkoi LEGE 03284]